VDEWFAALINESVGPEKPKADEYRPFSALRRTAGGVLKSGLNLPLNIAELVTARGGIADVPGVLDAALSPLQDVVEQAAPGYRAATDRIAEAVGGEWEGEAQADPMAAGEFLGDLTLDPLAVAKGAKLARPALRAAQAAARGERGALALRPAVSHVPQLASRLTESGGFTFDPRAGRFIEGQGFAVANPPGNKAVIIEGADNVEDAIQQAMAQNRNLLKKPGMMLGGWRDPETGKVFLEVSEVAPTRERALQLAKDRNEKAVFDLSSFENINNPHYAPEPRPSPVPAGRPAAVSLGAAKSPIQPKNHDINVPPAVRAYNARQAAPPGPSGVNSMGEIDDVLLGLGGHRSPGRTPGPWRPTSRGIFNRAAEPMQGSAPVDPRMVSKMGASKQPSELAQAISESKVVERGLAADAAEGLDQGGLGWYEAAPIRESFGEMGGPVTFEKFIDATGSGSIQNPTHNELATATALLFGEKRGLDVAGIKKAFRKMYPGEKKLWLNENTRTNYTRAAEAGAQLPRTPGNADRKVPWYTHGKLGGSLEAMPALDTHERKRLLQLAYTDPRIKKLIDELGLTVRPGGRSDLVPIQHALDYDALGAPYQRLAKQLGLPSTQAFQAGRWIGGGRHTGLLSQPQGDYIQTIEDVLAHTAKLRRLGDDPASLRALWQRAAQGDDILAPIYGKDPFRGLYSGQGGLGL
jgi:hypothetical protein